MSIRKHTLYNMLGAAIPIAVSLVTIPIYIGVIGESRYGVLAIAWLLTGYFGLFDLGLGRATAQRIAKLSGGQRSEQSKTFWTALVMNGLLGMVGAALLWPVSFYFFSNHFSLDAELVPEILGSVFWLAFAVPVATISGVLSGTLQGISKFFELNVVSIVGSALIQTMPLAVAVVYGPNLTWLIPSTIFVRVCVAAVLFQRCYSHILDGHGVQVSKALSRKLLRFGGWVTVSSIVGPMMVILDRFVIGAQLGARYVTFYTVPFQLAERSNVIPVALSSALFPRLAQVGLGEAGMALAHKALRSLAIVITPLFLFGIFFVRWFLTIWIGEDFATQASFVGQVLLLGFWGNAIARVPHALLQASGRPEIVARCHLAELIPYFFLLYLGLRYFGIVGAAVAFSIRAIVDGMLLLYWADILKSAIKTLAMPAILMVAAVLCARPGYSIWMLVIFGTVLICLYLRWSLKNMPDELAVFLKKLPGLAS